MINAMFDHPDHNVVNLTPDQRYVRLMELAEAEDTSDEGLLEFVCLLFGAEAQLSQ